MPGGEPRTKKNGTPVAIGATPGITSMARNGSPKVPGNCRTSARPNDWVAGSGRSPWTVISTASLLPVATRAFVTGAAGFGARGATGVAVVLGGSATGSGGGGGVNTTSMRIFAETASSPRRAGSN